MNHEILDFVPAVVWIIGYEVVFFNWWENNKKVPVLISIISIGIQVSVTYLLWPK